MAMVDKDKPPISYEDFSIICRVCLLHGDVEPFEINLLEVFKTIINNSEKEIDGKLPQNICKICSIKLKTFESFIHNCRKNEATLKNIYVDRENKNVDSSDTKSDTEDKFDPSIIIKYEVEEETEKNNEDLPNPKCGKELRTAVKKIENKINPIQCKTCNKTFNCKSSYAIHTRTHKPEQKKFLCNVCGKDFVKNAFLERHMQSHTGIKPYECNKCGKHFGQKSDVKRHLLTHSREKIFQCNQCDKVFHQKSCLDRHILTHTNEKNFPCSFCDKKFMTKAYLSVHTRTHTGVKPYQCPHCNKGFCQKGLLNGHILVHTKKKPFKCTQCGKTFTQSSRFKEHLRLHSGEKPFLCTYCGKVFAYYSGLSVHLKQHIGKASFICDYCNKGFYYASYLRNHIYRRHTNVKTRKSKNIKIVTS